MTTIFETFRKIGIIPVIEIDSVDFALPLANALESGNLPIMEITLRTPAALKCIERVAALAENVLVGAGTILDLDQAQRAVQVGAKFLVSPGFPEQVVPWAIDQSIPILAGAVTPTEMIRAISAGLTIVKFFPAEVMGGIRTIKAMSDPFPSLKFIPTGGIRPDNVRDYLQNPKIHAVGGSWMCKRESIAQGNFNEIERLAKQASQIIKQIREEGLFL